MNYVFAGESKIENKGQESNLPQKIAEHDLKKRKEGLLMQNKTMQNNNTGENLENHAEKNRHTPIKEDIKSLPTKSTPNVFFPDDDDQWEAFCQNHNGR